MLSALLRAAFSVSAFLRVELCWSRARIRAAAPRRRVRAARGWLGGWGTWTGVPPVSLLIPPKISLTQKFRRSAFNKNCRVGKIGRNCSHLHHAREQAALLLALCSEQ